MKGAVDFSEVNFQVRLFEEAIKSAWQEVAAAIEKGVADYLNPPDEPSPAPDIAHGEQVKDTPYRVVVDAFHVGDWVSILYDNKSIAGSIKSFNSERVKVGPGATPVFYKDIDRIEPLTPESPMVELKKQIEKLVAKNNELREKACVGEPKYDIAKERWRVCENGIECEHTELVSNEFGTYEQRRLMAAAPELADLIREEINELDIIVAEKQGMLIKRIKLLRRLGIPNVAPWYKGE